MGEFDKKLVQKEFLQGLNKLYKKLDNKASNGKDPDPIPLTPEEIEYGMDLVRKYCVYSASKGVKYGDTALDVIEERTAFGEFAPQYYYKAPYTWSNQIPIKI